MKSILFSFLALCISMQLSAQQYLVQATFLRNFSKSQMQSVFPENDIALYYIKYKTNDIYGNPDTASGAVMLPLLPNCDSFPLVNYNHGTVFTKMDVPSRQKELTAGQLYASRGFVATLPDYLGHGDSRGIHPYQHAESEATATIDMIRAAREFVAQQNLLLNGQVFLTGYSQGGHASMATSKYIQDNNLYGEFDVVASVPMSGAYDMSVTTANEIFGNIYSSPAYIIYLINSMQMAYGNIYDSLPEIYKQPYVTDVQNWLNGTQTLDYINNNFPDSIHLYIHDSILNGFINDPNHRLRYAISLSDVYDWAPTRELRMYYCEADEQVPYENAIKAQDTMIARGSTTVSSESGGVNENHAGCILPSFVNSVTHVLTFARRCPPPASVDEITFKNNISVYPNPSNGYVTIDSKENIENITIYNTIGKQITSFNYTSTGTKNLDLSSLDKGVYLILFTNSDKQQASKMITLQ